MSDEVWPGTSVAELSESDFEELYDLLEKQDPAAGHHGGAVARLATFLGLWRTLQGANLRIGLKQANVFVSAETAGPADMVQVGDKVRLILRQLFVPDLPHERCVVQLTWRASHWFTEKKKADVAHVTSCDAGAAGSAAAIGLPIFDELKVRDGLIVDLGMYAMADRGSQPILEFLGSSTMRSGLKLAGRFNPIFGMTVPYVQAAVAGLTKLSKRNFKLANWTFAFGIGGGSYPLCYGDYIALDGIVRAGSVSQPLAWSDLAWDQDHECPIYQSGPFRNPYLLLGVQRSAVSA